MSRGLEDDALPRANQPPPRATTTIGRETECAMLYTSGTTGRPKGCILTNDYFITAGEWYLSLGGEAALLGDTDRVLNPLPLYHMNALAVTATGMMCGGGCLISPDRFHPTSWWDDVISYTGNGDPLLRCGTAPADEPSNKRYRIESQRSLRGRCRYRPGSSRNLGNSIRLSHGGSLGHDRNRSDICRQPSAPAGRHTRLSANQ